MVRRRDLAEVLDTASALLAEEGLDGLTLRAIARRMDAHLNSVSHQVKTKRRLLELLSDRMLADVRLDGLPAAPRARASEIAARYRRVLLSQRDGARLMAGTSAIEQHTLAIGEALIGALLDGGADPVTATRTFWSLSYLILGAVQEEQGADPSAAARLEAALTAGSFPVLTQVEGSLVDDSFDARFTFALDALLDAAGLPVA